MTLDVKAAIDFDSTSFNDSPFGAQKYSFNSVVECFKRLEHVL